MSTHSKSHLNKASHATSTARGAGASLSAVSMERKPGAYDTSGAATCRYGDHPVTTRDGRPIPSGIVCEACAKLRAEKPSAKSVDLRPQARVMSALMDGPRTVLLLAGQTGLSKSGAYDALRHLRERGIVETAGKCGNCAIWRLRGAEG